MSTQLTWPHSSRGLGLWSASTWCINLLCSKYRDCLKEKSHIKHEWQKWRILIIKWSVLQFLVVCFWLEKGIIIQFCACDSLINQKSHTEGILWFRYQYGQTDSSTSCMLHFIMACYKQRYRKSSMHCYYILVLFQEVLSKTLNSLKVI